MGSYSITSFRVKVGSFKVLKLIPIINKTDNSVFLIKTNASFHDRNFSDNSTKVKVHQTIPSSSSIYDYTVSFYGDDSTSGILKNFIAKASSAGTNGNFVINAEFDDSDNGRKLVNILNNVSLIEPNILGMMKHKKSHFLKASKAKIYFSDNFLKYLNYSGVSVTVMEKDLSSYTFSNFTFTSLLDATVFTLTNPVIGLNYIELDFPANIPAGDYEISFDVDDWTDTNNIENYNNLYTANIELYNSDTNVTYPINESITESPYPFDYLGLRLYTPAEINQLPNYPKIKYLYNKSEINNQYYIDNYSQPIYEFINLNETGVSYNGATITTDSTNKVASFLSSSSQYIQFSEQIWFNVQFTITAKIYITSHTVWSRILDFGNGSASGNIVLGSSYGNSGKLFLTIYYNGFNAVEVVSPNALPTGQWIHVSATYDGTSIKLYVDGAQVSSLNTNIVVPQVFRKYCYAGKSNWTSDQYFNGSMKNIRIYTYALSSSEIAANYAKVYTNSSLLWLGEYEP